VATVDLLVYFW